jgi:hypothetical protein
MKRIVIIAAMLQASNASAAELRCVTDYYWGRAVLPPLLRQLWREHYAA